MRPDATQLKPGRAGLTVPGSEILDLSRDECLRLLRSHTFGRVAVTMDTPLIRPVNYIFDEPSNSIVFRTARGSKFHGLLRAGTAAFEVDAVEPHSRSGWSVIVVGMAEEVTSPTEVRRLDGLSLEPWAPGHKGHWMRIRARTVSGRRVVA
jgi:nitroimidazol reductase NimA-like FMN-containing flavoprotein (pyridoxamine 5'-phosphate oxidase superfamily)